MKFKELFTASDNETLETAYVLWILAVLTGIGIEVWSVISGHTFQFQDYGIGMGLLLGLGGLGKKLGQ